MPHKFNALKLDNNGFFAFRIKTKLFILPALATISVKKKFSKQPYVPQ